MGPHSISHCIIRHCRTQVCFYTFLGLKMSHAHSTLSVSAPHLYYTCPEGATVKLLCNQRGSALHPKDILKDSWLFTPHSDHLPPGLHFGSSEQNFWVLLQNVTHADQGRYCCMVIDIQVDHKHGSVVQKPHSHVVLQVTPRKDIICLAVNALSVASPGSVPVALAVAACILALLSLPLILVLVYKQSIHARTHTHTHNHFHSHAHGHENPVFLGGSPQIKTRTVSQIMTRQSSETGRHLLSEPGTPLSPPAHGDVFFPVEGRRQTQI
uniref:V-set immunoregulatory receptor n=1 Tax=Sparus aurata TaxID=8175 RepID=A0A671XI17_SPAAU